MRPPLRRDIAVLVACALQAVVAFRLHALAETPASVVRELFVRHAAGDLRGASELWIAGAPADDFVRRHRTRLEKRCLRLESLTIDAVSEEPPVFDASSTMTLHTSSPGAPEWWESSRSRVTLQRDGEAWRIASWEPRERELIERLLAEGAAAPEAILDASPELQTTTFVRLATQRGLDLVNQNRLDAAEIMTSAALAVAGRLGDPVSLSAALSARSVPLRSANHIDASLTVAEQAVVLAEGGGDPDVLARALVRLTRTREIADGFPAREPVERALRLTAELEEVSILAHAAVHLGRFYEARGQFRDAFRYAELASAYAEESGDPAALYSAAMFLTGAYIWIGDRRLSSRHNDRALEVARRANFELDAAGRTGGVVEEMLDRGNIAEALRTLDAALSQPTDPRSMARLVFTRAIAYQTMRDFEEAGRDLDRAAALLPADPAWKQVITYHRAIIAFMRRDDDAALRYTEEALEPNAGVSGAARHLRGAILLRNDRLTEARPVLEALIAEGDATPVIDPQRSLFHALPHPSQRLLLELLVLQGDGASALNVAEQLKGKQLTAVVTRGKNTDILAPDERARERTIEVRMRELNRRLVAGRLTGEQAAGVRTQITGAREDLIDFRQRLYAKQHTERVHDAGGICADALPAHLDDVTMVSYVIGTEQTLVFVLEPKKNGRRELLIRPIAIEEARLNERVAHLATLVAQRNLRTAEAAAEMYDILIRPIEPSVRNARSLCIIPDGVLWHVPFQVLGADGGPLLVERVPLFYAPSISVLAAAGSKRQERQTDRKPRLLAFANPSIEAKTASLYRTFDPDAPLGALPETESEVRAIARLYDSDTSRVYVGKTARETTLKEEASRFDILHIATHGVVYDHSPMFSSLLLTASPSDEQDDGVLEAREIAALALDADLTVLSACETGRAGALKGGGVIGLAWAFLAAGSPTTVASQWKAHSAATATLMVEFHRRLAAGHSKPEALRLAQLALRRDRRYRHPFYWAPFAVIGVP
ncbi:MAG TPA: CHAT domain-containing tetratricopeptide repeat protein [Thermoanaerobaculia bacterium]|nr:CHAT domain-containing tetratricopeptide repeat protein [Thermoanaerobaculia bacterium]